MTQELKRLIAQLVLGGSTGFFLFGIIHSIGRGDDGDMTLRKNEILKGERKVEVLGAGECVFCDNSKAKQTRTQ